MRNILKTRKIWFYLGGIGLFWITMFLFFLATPAIAVEFPEGISDLQMKLNNQDIIQAPAVSIQVDQPVTLILSITTEPGYNIILNEITIIMAGVQPFQLSNTVAEIPLTIPEGTSETVTIENFIFLDYVPTNLQPIVASLRGTISMTIEFEYTVNGAATTPWTLSRQINMPVEGLIDAIANPIGAAAAGATVVAAVVVGATAAAAVLPGAASGAASAATSAASTASGAAASSMLSGVRIAPTETLNQLLSGQLSFTAKGQVSKKLTTAAASGVSKKTCPICGDQFKRGVCHNCNKTYVQITKQYAADVKHWAEQTISLIKEKSELSVQVIAEKLTLSPRQAADVYIAMTKANLIFASNVAKKLGKKVGLMGASMAVSIVLWGLVGGAIPIGFDSLPVAIGVILLLTVVPFLGIRILERTRQKNLVELTEEDKTALEKIEATDENLLGDIDEEELEESITEAEAAPAKVVEAKTEDVDEEIEDIDEEIEDIDEEIEDIDEEIEEEEIEDIEEETEDIDEETEDD
ncbi:MAG: hypothetical protein ACFFC7_03890 [Candidatus Hermodarchaeota archaeon]